MANEDVTCLETLEIRNCSISSDTMINQALTGILQEPPELLETFDIRFVTHITNYYLPLFLRFFPSNSHPTHAH